MGGKIGNWVLISSLALAGGAAAQDQGAGQGQRAPQGAEGAERDRGQREQGGERDRALEAGAQRRAPGDESQGQQVVERRGQVTALRTRDVDGAQHLFAQVRTATGETLLFDMGPTGGLRDAGVAFRWEGDLRARGRETHMGSWPVLIVERFQLDGGPMQIVDGGRGARGPQGTTAQAGAARSDGATGSDGAGSDRAGVGPVGGQMARQPGPENEEGMSQDAMSRPRGGSGIQRGRGPGDVALGGTIADTRLYSLDGFSRKHRFVRVRLNGGQEVVVDVGVEPLDDVKLNPGEFVWVRGTLGRINHRPVVFATYVANPTTIDWTSVHDAAAKAAREGQPGQGQPGEPDQQGGALEEGRQPRDVEGQPDPGLEGQLRQNDAARRAARGE